MDIIVFFFVFFLVRRILFPEPFAVAVPVVVCAATIY